MQTDSQLAQLILYGAGILLLGAFAWIVKTVRDITTMQAKIAVVLFGYNGNNGMASEIANLRKSSHEVREALQGHVNRIAQLEGVSYHRRATDIP